MDNGLRIYTTRRVKPNFWDFLRGFSVTNYIIFLNVFFFILFMLLVQFFGEKIFYYIALQPIAFFSGIVWTLITSMFMHGNLSHLFVNMVSLFFIGSFVEKLIGRKRFFWLYMISGIFAGLLFVFLAYYLGQSDLGMRIFGSPSVFAVGASGAIFALGGLLAILTPKLRVYVFFIIPMQMWVAMFVLLFVLWAASIGANLSIGNTAHFGGLLAGVVYAFYLKKRYKRKTALISKYFSS